MLISKILELTAQLWVNFKDMRKTYIQYRIINYAIWHVIITNFYNIT